MWMGRRNPRGWAEDVPEATGEHNVDDRRRAQRTGGHGPVDGSEEVPNRPLSTSSTATGRRGGRIVAAAWDGHGDVDGGAR